MFKLSFVCNQTGTAVKGLAYHPEVESLLDLANTLQLNSEYYSSMVIAIEENHTTQNLNEYGIEYCTTVGTAFYTDSNSRATYGNTELLSILLN